jgi:hypothetical protein
MFFFSSCNSASVLRTFSSRMISDDISIQEWVLHYVLRDFVWLHF